jgi:CheY-like chemotaxis protein
MPEMDADDDDADLILDEDDDPAEGRAQRDADANPWRILIVDDDVDVHVVTKFALNNIEFQGRRLSYLHAYTAAEAITAMRTTPHIALVLLDVVMDEPDAGLRVVRQIRRELHNDLVRIVLRTGQPGQQQENSLLLDYDINDFWSKSDLTTRKLVTTVISSLRTYGALAAADQERSGLRVRLAHAETLRAGLDQHLALLVLDRHGRVLEASAALCRLLAMNAAALLGRLASALTALGPAALPLADISAALDSSGTWRGALALRPAGGPVPVECVIQVLQGADGQLSGYLVLGSLCHPD